MKKILILSYFYPPANFVGAERIASFARHLHKFGYYPIIVTRNWNENQTNTYEEIKDNSFKHRIFETHEEYYLPYNRSLRDKLFGKTCFFCTILRRLLTVLELIASNFCIDSLPYTNLYTKAQKILKNDSTISAVIVSGSPFESFHFGYKLKQEFPKLHWIPDYRDEWTTFQGVKSADPISKLLAFLAKNREVKWTSNASLFITVSDYWVINIRKLINVLGVKVMNGYEADSIMVKDFSLDPNEFIIVYNGTIYSDQDFTMFNGALNRILELYSHRLNITLKFIGLSEDANITKKIENIFVNTKLKIVITKRVAKNELINLISQSDLMLLCAYGNVKGWYPVKIFDYYLVNRPILLCPSDEAEMESFILETKCGVAVHDIDECFSYIEKLIQTKMSGVSDSFRTDRVLNKFYTREHQASILAQHLNDLLKSNASAYQICKRCVMDTSDEDIVFDEQGICQHCRDFEKVLQQPRYQKDDAKERLADMISTIKAKGKKYDCLVGISGGVDSCYTAYLCHKWGLNPLLLHMDNGWNSEIAVSNIEKLVDKLGLDYISYVLDWNEFREIQLAFLKSSIVDLELPTDIAIPASLYETAVKYDIPFIMSGGNYSGEGILPLTWGYHVLKDANLYRAIVKNYTNTPLKKIPVVGLWGEIYYKFFKQIKTLYPLNLVDYNKDEAREFLKNEFGWTDYGGKHHESKITAFWQSYAMPTKYKMDYRRATYSSQIVSGQITREEALEKLKELPFKPESILADKEYIAKKFGIPLSELESYLALPPKTFKDFPNQKKLIQWFYRIYKKYLG